MNKVNLGNSITQPLLKKKKRKSAIAQQSIFLNY